MTEGKGLCFSLPQKQLNSDTNVLRKFSVPNWYIYKSHLVWYEVSRMNALIYIGTVIYRTMGLVFCLNSV
jgi:hypothetical protein